ncbi:MAG: hypothetical protein IKH82_00670 [Clostridiales bacterium]|nr:hypothetical protein [Clostridiales bacterium]
MLLALSAFEDFIDNFIEYAIMAAPPLLFIVFLILFIVNIRKVRQDRKKRIKAIVFGSISVVFLMIALVEIFLIVLMAMAVAHM